MEEMHRIFAHLRDLEMSNDDGEITKPFPEEETERKMLDKRDTVDTEEYSDVIEVSVKNFNRHKPHKTNKMSLKENVRSKKRNGKIGVMQMYPKAIQKATKIHKKNNWIDLTQMMRNIVRVQ